MAAAFAQSYSLLANLIRKAKNVVKEVRAMCRRGLVAKRLPTRRISAESAVVVAPHPDDETFGTGGLIALKRAQGIPVTVILLTDGAASLSAFPKIMPQEVGRVRSSQAVAAADCLGLDREDVIGLGLVDGQIPHEGEPGFDDAVARLASELDRRAPSEIYSPHPHDGLPDHEAAASMVLAALRRTNRRFRIIFYVVWAWLNARSPLRRCLDLHSAWRLDIRSVHDRKRGAVAEYLGSERAPGGHPYCGYLPAAVTRSARADYEVFFDWNGTS